MQIIPYGFQDICQEDIDAVIDVLRSDFLTQGPVVSEFEKAVASYCGALDGVAVNSATSALHIACLSLGVARGDVVWTSPITFVASANCALYCGATVDFVDIDPNTYNISLINLEKKLVEAKKRGTLPKVVIPVHLCGQSCDMEGIFNLSKRYGFKIIEDASHAIGGKYQSHFVGNCRYSDITIFSFHPVKIITTGEGGMATTNDLTLAKRMRLLRSHGITNSLPDMIPFPGNEIWNYQQIDLGFNYRMTDIQAALGLSQMRRLDYFVERRRQIAKYYDDNLKKLSIVTPWQNPDSYSAYHLYPIRIKSNASNISQRQLWSYLRDSNIQCNLHYIPVYRQPYYQSIGFKSNYCPEAELYFKEAISLPIFPAMTENQQKLVISLLEGILN